MHINVVIFLLRWLLFLQGKVRFNHVIELLYSHLTKLAGFYVHNLMLCIVQLIIKFIQPFLLLYLL